MNKHFKDLRQYLFALEKIGEMQQITVPVDLDLEIGAISRRAGETGQAAPLFENIKGAVKGFRVLGAPGCVSSKPGQELARIALAVGLPPTATGREIVLHIADARDKKPIEPKILATGPCKENIITGDAINLTEIPAPLLHDGDGGRYINTFGIVCVETPDKKWRSWSIARIMVVDGKRMAGIIAPNQHIGMVRQAWTDIGKPMPYALALGAEPYLPYVGGMPLPDFVNECDFAGALFGEAIEVVKAETVDILVPATAEIVVEGHVSLSETAMEGPMGEYAGYLWEGPGSQKPVYHISAITHRNNAILPIAVAGEPPEENHTAWGIPNAAEIVFQLRQAKLPVAMAWSPFESANHWFAIAIERDWRKTHPKMTSSELCQAIGNALLKTKAGMGTPKYIVVNDDIDITNTKELVWAYATRNHPGSQGEIIFNDSNTNPLVAYINNDEKMSLRTAKVIYNCLDPEHLGGKLPKRSSFHYAYPKALQEKVLSRWGDYGYATGDKTKKEEAA